MDMIIQKDWSTLGQAPHGRSLLERVLQVRGLETQAQSRAFLDCSLDSLSDPYLLPDMAIAARRLARAVRDGEPVLVHGDYDADGLTATALLARLLRLFGTPVTCIIPDRLTDGYGVSVAAVTQILAAGGTGSTAPDSGTVRLAGAAGAPAADSGTIRAPVLMVTVDCGISAAAEIARLAELGVETIVTDHHECPQLLPAALALVNPRLPGSACPFPALAGVGVAYKLAQALCQELGCPGREQPLLDLVAIGTVADVMPLTGENRILTANGLAMVGAGRRAGLQALLAVSRSSERRVTATTIGYSIAPRLNAAGRMGSARRALDLLLTDEPAEAARLAGELDALNRDRQALETEIFTQAVSDIDSGLAGAGEGPIVVARDGWHHGIVGIVASRLVEQYLRPAIVLGGESGVYRGSGRTFGSFNLLEAIASAGEFTQRYGGHRKAAGLTLTEGQLPDFRLQVARYGEANPDPERLRPAIVADLTVEADELTLAAAHDLERLMPFGEENREPLFIIHGLRILEIRAVGSNGRSVKFQLRAETGAGAGSVFDGISFRLPGVEASYSTGELVDVLFSFGVNFFNGRESCQMQVVDLRPHAAAEEAGRSPGAADFRSVYQYLASRFGQRPVLADLPLLGRHIGRDSRTPIDGRAVGDVLQVLADAGLVQLQHQGGERVILQLLPTTGERIRLQDVPSYRQLMARAGGEP